MAGAGPVWPKLALPTRKKPMAKPNYSFEKKQREIAKKKKQDEKLARKQASRESSQAENTPPAESDPSSGGSR